MKTFSLIATAAIVGSLGLSAAPVFAAQSSTASVPYCSAASADELSQTKQALADQLQLSTKLGSSIEEWNGCLKVMYTQDGHTTVAFYDPSSLALVDTLGVAS
jgi:hypothetical protein